jgi:uncharacterized protein (TIGR02145 family)
LAKHAKTHSAINDVIAVTKDGYLNYRCVQYNSDTSGIEIKMIASAGTLTDADGNVYQTVRIGTQVWMAENLRVTKYNDGTAIFLDTSTTTWADSTTAAYCFYNNTTNADSIKKYGALYNWYAVNTGKLAPSGWHVPYDEEWTVLEKYLGLNGYNWDGTTDTTYPNKIAKSLAAKTDWCTDTARGTIGLDLTENNCSGFSAIPGGSRVVNGTFYHQSIGGDWWSASVDYDSYAWYRSLHCNSDYIYSHYANMICGFSVRLLRDN